MVCFFNIRSGQGDQDMKFKNLVVLFAAIFLLAACESTSIETGSASGNGKGLKNPNPNLNSKGFSTTPGSAQDLVSVGDSVFFGLNKSKLSSVARSALEKQAVWLKKYGAVKVNIEGHADERGTREYNLALGERRANATKDFLVALGVSPNRIKTISYGKERPVALGHAESSWLQNRRAVTKIFGAGS
jgi:peptidoglycan-associated lipoprotein